MDWAIIWNELKDYIGWVAGLAGLYYAIRADRKQKEQERLQKEKDERNEYLFRIAELHVDKGIKKEEIKELEQEADKKQTTLQLLTRRIQEDIPRMAQRAFALEQLNLSRDNVIEAYRKWQKVQQQFPGIESDSALLPLEISKAIEEHIQPEFIRKEKIANWQYTLGVLGTLTAMIGLFQRLFNSDFLLVVLILLALGTIVAVAEVLILRLPPINIKQASRRTLPLFIGCFLILSGIIGLLLVNNLDNYYGQDVFIREVSRFISNNYLQLVCISPLGIMAGGGILIIAEINRGAITTNIARIYDDGQTTNAIEKAEYELVNDPANFTLFEKYLEMLFNNNQPERAADVWFKKFEVVKTKNIFKNEKRNRILNKFLENPNKDLSLRFTNQLILRINEIEPNQNSLKRRLDFHLEQLSPDENVEQNNNHGSDE